MDISYENRRKIVDEINFVLPKMKESQTALEKIYYFSGIQTLIQRIFNVDYNSDLLFMYHIFKSTHEAFVGRIQAIQSGDITIKMNDKHFDKLESLLNQFSEIFEENRDVYGALCKFVELLYSTTGNGNYLREKGILKI